VPHAVAFAVILVAFPLKTLRTEFYHEYDFSLTPLMKVDL